MWTTFVYFDPARWLPRREAVLVEPGITPFNCTRLGGSVAPPSNPFRNILGPLSGQHTKYLTIVQFGSEIFAGNGQLNVTEYYANVQ